MWLFCWSCYLHVRTETPLAGHFRREHAGCTHTALTLVGSDSSLERLSYDPTLSYSTSRLAYTDTEQLAAAGRETCSSPSSV